MFSVVKVRDDVKRGDLSDPGPYRHPAGTQAREFDGTLAEPVRAQGAPADEQTLRVRKPGSHDHEHH